VGAGSGSTAEEGSADGVSIAGGGEVRTGTPSEGGTTWYSPLDESSILDPAGWRSVENPSMRELSSAPLNVSTSFLTTASAVRLDERREKKKEDASESSLFRDCRREGTYDPLL